MKLLKSLNIWSIALIAATVFLTSCGGGTTTTAGVGGSGIGGTGGITTVNGNVAAVTAQASLLNDDRLSTRMLAVLVDLVSAPVNAQTGNVVGIQVVGGDQQTVTDQTGSFSLSNVTPSGNFILTMILQDGQQVQLPIGLVQAGATVQVVNIVINKSQGSATPGSVEKEDGNSNDPDNENNDDGNSNVDGDSGGNDNDNDNDNTSGGNSGPG